jgi:hypothetical protein
MRRAPSLSLRDRVCVVLLTFFVLVGFTLELWWLRHGPGERVLARGDSFSAHLFDIYGACDRNYFESRTPFTVALEAINVYFTQALNLWLICAILRRKPYRYPLQLAVGAYVSYSVALYFLVAHVGGYPDMRYRSRYTFFLFFGVNAPWLLGHLYLVADAWLAVRARFPHSIRASAGSAWAETNEVSPGS